MFKIQLLANRLPTACQGAKSQQLAGTTEGVTILV